MHPLQNGSQVTERPANKPVSGLPGYFTESGENNVPSYPGADWFNHVIAEFQNALTANSIAFDSSDDENLSRLFAFSGTSSFRYVDDIDGNVQLGQLVSVEDYANGHNSGRLYFKVVEKDTGTDDGGSYIDLPISQLQLRQNLKFPYNNKAWGAKGDGVNDDTQATSNFVSFVKSMSDGVKACFSKGVYLVSSLPEFSRQNITYSGAGSEATVFKFSDPLGHFSCDAFYEGDNPNAQFANNCNMMGFSVIGHPQAEKVVVLQGVARSFLFDLKAYGSDISIANSIGFDMRGVQLSTIGFCHSSYQDSGGIGVNLPYRGLFMRQGTRDGVSVGACSNNVFIGCHFEGHEIGGQWAQNGADQNIFIGGSMEACLRNGFIGGNNCRYNTMIGVGFENKDATIADVDDSSTYTLYSGCYSSKNMIIKGRGISVERGFFERLEFTSSSEGCSAKHLTVNNWDTGNGGLIDASPDLRLVSVYDADTGEYYTPRSNRIGVSVGASPFSYKNELQIPCKILIRSGSVEVVQIENGGDSWIEPNPTAAGLQTGDTGIYILQPGEVITVTYSSLPTMNRISLGGL